MSSTFVDLREHRAKVIETLRQLGHDVVAMENYVAEDQIPLETCVRDVSSCEIYVGIFGWRYESSLTAIRRVFRSLSTSIDKRSDNISRDWFSCSTRPDRGRRTISTRSPGTATKGNEYGVFERSFSRKDWSRSLLRLTIWLEQ